MNDKAAVLRIERRKLDDLRPHPQNESIRKHPIAGSAEWDALKASLADCYFDPIVVNVRLPLNGVLVSGHLRRKVLMADGFTHADVSIVELTEHGHLARMIAANRMTGEDVFAALADVLSELDTGAINMELTGMTDAEREEIAAWTPEPDAKPEENAVPEPPKEPITKPGELIELGRHRVLCGDCKDTKNIVRLMGEETPAGLVTDPPYGIGAVKVDGTMRGAGLPLGSIGRDAASKGTVDVDGIAKRGRYLQITNDDKPFDPTHLLEAAPVLVIFSGNHFANQLPRSSRWLVWDKKNESGSGTFFSDAELIWTNLDGVRCTIYRYTWTGMIRAGSRDVELTERVHPTQKPVGLLTAIIRDCVEGDGAIADWYLGSGTTLIAAEQLNRTCYGIEIEPRYCDVIVRRYYNYVGWGAAPAEHRERWEERGIA